VRQLALLGGKVAENRPPQLRWEREISVADTLAGLERRTWSSLWGIPDADHERLIRQTRTWAGDRFGGLDATETVHAWLTLYSAHKS
jgi:hypothetical protein